MKILSQKKGHISANMLCAVPITPPQGFIDGLNVLNTVNSCQENKTAQNPYWSFL